MHLISKEKKQTSPNAKFLTLVGIMAAVICIIAPFSIPLPFSPIPISLTNLAIYFAIYVLGMKKGTLSYLIYLFIGFIGVPVFSSFTSGPAKLFGPTGGYLIGFIFMAMICGFFIEHWPCSRLLCFSGLALGTAVSYLFGTVWLAYQANLSFYAALSAGVLPFILGDLVKITFAVLLGPQIRKRLKRAGLN